MEAMQERSGSSLITTITSRARETLVPNELFVGETAFNWKGSRVLPHQPQPGRRVLNELVHLTSGDDREGIRRFVQERGLLLPGAAGARPLNWSPLPEGGSPLVGGDGVMAMSEWEGLARSAHATLEAIGAVERGDTSGLNWEWLRFGPTGHVRFSDRSLTGAADAIVESVRQWQGYSEMSVQLADPPDRGLVLEGKGLAAVVAFELLAAYLNPQLVGFCSVCATPYVGLRKPPAGGRENFCDRHRVTGKSRLAKQRERSFKSGPARLAQEARADSGRHGVNPRPNVAGRPGDAARRSDD